MNRYIKAMLLVAASLPVAWPVFAHEEFRLVGTIAQRDPATIQVLTTEGRRISVQVDVVSRIWRGDVRVDATELKTGANVVVRALGDSEEDLIALEINLMPAAGGQAR